MGFLDLSGNVSPNLAASVNAAMLAGGGKALYGGAYDAATAGGMAFLVGELEKLDPKIREPLTAVTWPRDVPVKTGGGWVDYTSMYNVNYGTAGANHNGVQGGSSTAIPTVQVDLSKDIYKVFTWMNVLKVGMVDQNKLQQIGRSLEDLLDKGLRLNHQKALDENCYTGFSDYGTTGLINNPAITTGLAAAAGTGSSTAWTAKTADQILADVNTAMTDAWETSEYDLRGMPNHILLPPQQYAYLVNQKVSEAGNVSILEYLLKNNIGVNQGVDLAIVPCRWCIGAGTSGKDRMVLYNNDEDMLYFDMTVPLTRAMTQPSVGDAAYLTLYAAQFGQVKFSFTQPVRYVDGI
jgi:hypothetical protein